MDPVVAPPGRGFGRGSGRGSAGSWMDPVVDPKTIEKTQVFQTFPTKVVEILWFSNIFPQKLKKI